MSPRFSKHQSDSYLYSSNSTRLQSVYSTTRTRLSWFLNMR